jgi:hypothetical protein
MGHGAEKRDGPDAQEGNPSVTSGFLSPVIRRYRGFKDHTVWLGLPERAEAFGRDKSVILRHLKHP